MNMDRLTSLRESVFSKSELGDICEFFKEVYANSFHDS